MAPQVQLAFWGASLPVCLVAYGLASGHWPDLGDQEDVAKFSAEAFAYVNVARLAAPLRVGAALSLTLTLTLTRTCPPTLTLTLILTLTRAAPRSPSCRGCR